MPHGVSSRYAKARDKATGAVSAALSIAGPYLSSYGLVGLAGVQAGQVTATLTLTKAILGFAYSRWRNHRQGLVATLLAGATLTQLATLMKVIKTTARVLHENWPTSLRASLASPFDQPPKYYFAWLRRVPPEVVPVLVLIALRLQRPKPVSRWNRLLIAVKLRQHKQPDRRPRNVAFSSLLAIIALRLMLKCYRSVASPIGATLTTMYIKRSLRSGTMSSSQQRQVFVDLPLVKSKRPKAPHTHGESANNRTAGSHTASLACRVLGLEPYYLQMSLADVRKGRDGDRSYHWAKDIGVAPVEFHYSPGRQALVLIDVDHYVDMPKLLARYPGTFFLSTFQPTACGCATGEYSFAFQTDGKVCYRVSGGAEYVHHVWDYSSDTLLVEDAGFVKKTVSAYHIDKKPLDDHHCLIMLSLIGTFDIPSIVPTSWVLSGKPLERLNPVVGQHAVLDVAKKDGLYRSVSILGDHNCVTLEKSKLDAIHAVALVAKVPITPAMVASNIAPSSPAGLPTERLPPGHAAILSSYLRAGTPPFPPVVYPPDSGLVPIWYDKHDYSAKIPLASFGSPLIGPCYAHAMSIATEDRCIKGRIEKFHDPPGFEEPMPPMLYNCMMEFLEFVVPVKHVGHPVDDDYIAEKQDSPSQRMILDEAGVTGDNTKSTWGLFVKKETYTKPTDPRPISQAKPKIKREYSRFMYAFHNGVMAEQRWYAFNKTPVEIADEVCNILRSAAFATIADGNRFDGHVKRAARILERLAMLRYFAPEHHSAIDEAMDKQFGIKGASTLFREYFSGYSRGSGSLETSDFNSLLSSFIGYLARRMAGQDSETAYRSIGIYGGDDSLEADVDPDCLRRAATLMRQDYDVDTVRRGDIGVEFLNRQFGPDVWNGDPSSMANPSRLLSKLFVGPAGLHDPLQRFAERASGYYRMDKNSPVIGAIVRVAHELLGDREDGELMPWDGRHPAESNWPNVDSGWMIDVFTSKIPDFDFDRFYEWIDVIDNVGDAKLLLEAPLCTAAPDTPPATKTTCVIGDEVVYGEVGPTLPAAEVTLSGVTPIKPDVVMDELEEACAALGAVCITDTAKAIERVIEVNEASRRVPGVDAKGAKTSPPTSSYDTSPAKNKQPVPETKPKGSDKPQDPREWTAPTKRTGESDEHFRARLATWEEFRAKTIVRLGLAP